MQFESSYLSGLPSHLSERIRQVNESPAVAAGEMVLYWMRTALRTDENPALDVAILLAKQLDLPLLVYQGLSQRYPYASDRHHAFIMQAAADVQHSMRRRSVSYAFHLERPDINGDYLYQLASRASVLITEDMPTDPPRYFLRGLRRRCHNQNSTPTLLLVDTACVAPMNLVGKAYDRAFAYRSKTKRIYSDRISRPWPAIKTEVETFDLETLPFPAIDFKRSSITELVAGCEIDHSIGAVLDTCGGSEAGYRRWQSFVDNGLSGYAKKRNNALLDGVSRMSAYLHYGMVSPMRLAREAASIGNAGAEKYLDELLIWRELAYAFCRYRKDHHLWSGLPAWAKETLEKHAGDRRPELYSWEELARGATHDDLWNAAQKSLLIHGELHNNVRMTWGKAFLNWTESPRDALRLMVDLNHRYALDGRDPASYGGLLWCLGQFDRPFKPEQPIFGSVRTRPLSYHAQRLSPAKYAARTSVSRAATIPRVAVVGAGISGATAARILADHGLPVTILEKSRGAGGRMATRRTEFGNFDHGAQYFTARDERFRRYVKSWIKQGIVAEWTEKIVTYEQPRDPQPKSGSTTRYVATPAMNSLAKHLVNTAMQAGQVDLRTDTLVHSIDSDGDGWLLIDSDGKRIDHFDRLVVTPPAPQSESLLRNLPELQAQLEGISIHPCWSAMVAFTMPLDCDWAGAFVNHGPLSWIARNTTKAGRVSTHELLTIHGSQDWSREHLEQPADWVAKELLEAFWQLTGMTASIPDYLIGHRWRYSIPEEPLTERCLVNEEGSVVACGDWAGGPRVEGAFLSGAAAAGRILGSLAPAKQAAGQLQLDLH